MDKSLSAHFDHTCCWYRSPSNLWNVGLRQCSQLRQLTNSDTLLDIQLHTQIKMENNQNKYKHENVFFTIYIKSTKCTNTTTSKTMQCILLVIYILCIWLMHRRWNILKWILLLAFSYKFCMSHAIWDNDTRNWKTPGGANLTFILQERIYKL